MFSSSLVYHVQKSSGMQVYIRFGRGETETDEFGVKEPPQRKANFSERFGCFDKPGSHELDQFCFMERQENGNKMTIRVGAPGNWCGVVSVQVH